MQTATLDTQKMLRLQKMLDWRLKQGTTPYHEAEASALQWALSVIGSCFNGNGNDTKDDENGLSTIS